MREWAVRSTLTFQTILHGMKIRINLHTRNQITPYQWKVKPTVPFLKNKNMLLHDLTRIWSEDYIIKVQEMQKGPAVRPFCCYTSHMPRALREIMEWMYIVSCFRGSCNVLRVASDDMEQRKMLAATFRPLYEPFRNVLTTVLASCEPTSAWSF